MMGFLLDEVYSEYSTKLPRRTKAVSFYTKSSEDQDPNDTVQILNDLSSPSYSALCPLSRVLQTIPVRTDSCRHIETFDLHSSLMSATSVDVATCYRGVKLEDRVDVPVCCPVCKAKDKLYVDELIEAFLKSNPAAEKFKFTDAGEVVSCNEEASNLGNDTIDLVSPSLVDCTHHEVPQRKSSVSRGQHLISSDQTRPDCISPVPFRHCRNPFYSPIFHQEVFSYPSTFSHSSNGDVFQPGGATLRRRFSTVDLISPAPRV